MKRETIKIFLVRYHNPVDKESECYFVEALATETPYSYSFAKEEAYKIGRHRVEKRGLYAPAPEEALRRFYAAEHRDATAAEARLSRAHEKMCAAQVLASKMGLPVLDPT